MLRSHRKGWFAFVALTGAVLSVVAYADDDPAPVPPDGTVVAIWRIENVELVYHSTTVRYSCVALQRRIAAILHAVGAHSSISVAMSCSNGDLVRYASARITLAVPVEASEENVREATDFDTRAELVARMQQKQLPTATDIERFAASWRTVSLTRNPPLSLGAGDCDLLRAMRDQLFPLLRVRVVSSGLSCGAGSDTRILPRINVNALVPART